MFSRLLRYARSFFTFQSQQSLMEPAAETKAFTTAMVTVRQQSGSNLDHATHTSAVLESLSPKTQTTGLTKRKWSEATDDSTIQMAQDGPDSTLSLKKNKLAVREKDEKPLKRHTHIAIEIPVRDIMQHDSPMWTAPGNGKVNVKKTLKYNAVSRPESRENDNEEKDQLEDNQKLDLEAQNQIGRVIASHNIPEKTVKERIRKKNVGKELSTTAMSSLVPTKASTIPTTATSKHKRFDSEEPAAEEFDVVAKDTANIEEDDNESSDDDDDGAPEVVATHDAQEQAKITARSSAKAVEKQDAARRKKRKERDGQLKEQAKAGSKKRKGDDHGNGSHAISTFGGMAEHEDQDSPSGSAAKDHSNSSNSLFKVSKSNLPEYLPAEYLEDDPIEDYSSIASIKNDTIHKSKKIKFHDPPPKKTRDRKRGSTIYRVAETNDSGLLAPKAAISARAVKEAWLNGQRGPGGNRKVIKRGFFKGSR